MKHLLFSLGILLFFLFACSCTKKKSHSPSYIVQYKTTTITEADFIKKLMITGYALHGKNFFNLINDQDFFDNLKEDTLTKTVTELLVEELAKEKKITVTEAELTEWIKSHTKNLSKEDLILTLKTNNLTYRDWKNLFKSQVLQHKVLTALDQTPSTQTTEPEKKEQKKTTTPGTKIAVLDFSERTEAEEAYKKFISSSSEFDEELKRRHISNPYSWIANTDIPFYDQIKNIPLKRLSKPIETQWGTLIVRVIAKGNMPAVRDNFPTKNLTFPSELLTNFKNDPELKINSKNLYGLKINK